MNFFHASSYNQILAGSHFVLQKDNFPASSKSPSSFKRLDSSLAVFLSCLPLIRMGHSDDAITISLKADGGSWLLLFRNGKQRPFPATESPNENMCRPDKTPQSHQCRPPALQH